MELNHLSISLAIATAALLARLGEAQAIPLPDNSSCLINGAPNACLKITNTSTGTNGAGIYGVTNLNSNGVNASSTSGVGIDASSGSGYGVQAGSQSKNGVVGTTAAGRPSAGVFGQNTSTGYGVIGRNYFFDTSCMDLDGTNCAAAILGDSGHNMTDTWAGLFNGDVNLPELYIDGFETLSDARLETGVEGLKYALAQVLELRPVTYKMKAGNRDRTYLGFLAQDVQKLIPELVMSRGSSDLLSLNYEGLVPVLVKAIQQRAEGIRQRELRIAALEKRRRSPFGGVGLNGSMGAAAALGGLPLGLCGFAMRRARRSRTRGPAER